MYDFKILNKKWKKTEKLKSTFRGEEYNWSNMAEGSNCKSAMRGESSICCNGVCGNIYHFTKRDASIEQFLANIVE